MSYMSLRHTKTRGANETLVFWGLTSESLTYKGNLRNHTLPRLLHTLARLKYFKHLVLSDRANLRKRNLPLASLLLTLLLNSITKYFGTVDLVTLEQICWQSILRSTIFGLMLIVTLFMHGNCFLHKNLLSMALLGKHFTLKTDGLLSILRPFVHFTSFFFPHALKMIHTLTIALLVKLDMLVLGHFVSTSPKRVKMIKNS
mmetsp:Transcript_11989/g.21501  ORF Transcript_11989/g.21501 Transcript_11989/m.21501 type:complete len:201 (+) Transcript_11989:1078-1680(+)